MKPLQGARTVSHTTPFHVRVVNAIWDEARKHEFYTDKAQQEFLQLVEHYRKQYLLVNEAERLPLMLQQAHQHFESTYGMTASQFYHLEQAFNRTADIIEETKQSLLKGTPREYAMAQTLDMRDDVAADISARFIKTYGVIGKDNPAVRAYPMAMVSAIRDFMTEHDAMHNKTMLCNGTTHAITEVTKSCERELLQHDIDVHAVPDPMSLKAYVTVGVNMKEFMANRNPTTQPGLEVTYYASLSEALQHSNFTDDGHSRASCVLMVNADVLKSSLRPSQDPNILGYGTLRPQYVVDAMLQWYPSAEENVIYIDASKCNWDMARNTVKFYQEERFVQQGITWDVESNGIVPFANAIRDKYIAEILSTKDDQNLTLHGDVSRIETAMRMSFDEAYREAQGSDYDKIQAGLQSAYKAAITEGSHISERVSELLTLYAPVPISFMNQQSIVPNGLSSHRDANYCAEAAFVRLPDDMRQLASDTFNHRLYEMSLRPDFQSNMDKYTAITIAYTYDAIQQAMPKQPLEVSAQVKLDGMNALIHALHMGANHQDAILIGMDHMPDGQSTGDVLDDDAPEW